MTRHSESYPEPEVGPADPSDRPRPLAAVGLLVLALASVALAIVSGFGSRWGIWNFGTGFTFLRWAAYGGIATLVLAVPVLWFTRPGASGRRGFVIALGAVVLAVPVVAVPLGWQRTARSVPPIHDITTDLENPPEFVQVAPLRADASNPVEYPGPEVAAQQREAYPDIRPAVLDLPIARAFPAAMDAAVEMGWSIVGSDPATGRIEATDRTFWFGFRDDIVIRLTPSGERTIVDVRSKSRVGRSDVGTNAQRIREYLAELSTT